MGRSLPPDPSLEHLAKQAKKLLRDARSGDADALALLPESPPESLKLADAQRALAASYGFSSWARLKAEIAARTPEPEPHEHVAWFGEFQELVGRVDEAVRVPDRLDHEVEVLVEAHRAGHRAATVPLRFHTAGLKEKSVDEILAYPVSLEEAREAVAALYWFPSWDDAQESSEVIDPGFEAAVDAVVGGDEETLARLLSEAPERVRERSPFGHRSCLLHYVSANGVESWRQRTPARIVEIIQALLTAGAEVDAPSGAYGAGPHGTPLCLTVSSAHPADAGLQIPIVDALLHGGAAIEGVTDDGMPLTTALAFGYLDTARHLVGRGARIRSLTAAAGLGRADVVRQLLGRPLDPAVDPFGRLIKDRPALLDRALLQCARTGRTEIASMLLDAGANANASFEHARTPMHWAAYSGLGDFVELLLAHGGDPTVADSYYGSPPSAWAWEGGHKELAEWLAGLSPP